MAQFNENDLATYVVIHSPDDDVVSTASTHPLGFLYNNHTNVNTVQRQYSGLRTALESAGVRVETVREIITRAVSQDPAKLDELRKLAFDRITYKLDPRMDLTKLSQRDRYIFSDEYKREAVAQMDISQLIRTVFTQPTVTLSNVADENLPATVQEIKTNPLTNLQFIRDQQLVTAKGVVLGNLHTLRRGEVAVMKFIHQCLGHNIIYQTESPLQLEGGDFFPVSDELCFIGFGPRTNEAAIRDLLKKDVFGTRRVAVVRNIFDRDEKSRHLDDVFNIVSKDCVVLLESTIGQRSLTRRLVTEYFRDETTNGKYVVSARDIEFGQYLVQEGFHVIPVPDSLRSSINMLNLGNGHVLVSSAEMANLLTSDKVFAASSSNKVTVVDFNGVEAMYGGIRACTLVLRQRQEGTTVVQRKEGLKYLPVIKSATGAPSQTTDTIMMVAPIGFRQNPETQEDNYFMQKSHDVYDVHKQVLLEFSALHRELSQTAKVDVVLYVNENYSKTPDAVFPNNWVSTHALPEMQGTDAQHPVCVLYPLKVPSRSRERRQHIIQDLEKVYKTVINLSSWENTAQNQVLEGTGSIVLDRVRRVAYVSLSQRADEEVLEDWAERMNYRTCVFRGTDAMDRPIYHTNVIMAVGSTVAVICLESIRDPQERERVRKQLSEHHEVVEITLEQMNNFCGNVLELHSKSSDGDGKVIKSLAMSTCAYNHFTPEQKAVLLRHVDQLVHSDIATIERIGGGSVRCTIGELF